MIIREVELTETVLAQLIRFSEDWTAILKEAIETQDRFDNEEAFQMIIGAKEDLPIGIYAAMIRYLQQTDTEGVALQTLIDAYKGVDRQYFMTERELNKFAKLPDSITIFRRTENPDELQPRISWTLVEEKSLNFGNAHFFKATIPKKQAFAYYSESDDENQTEEEIVAYVTDYEIMH